jgi:hypothetical protein
LLGGRRNGIGGLFGRLLLRFVGRFGWQTLFSPVQSFEDPGLIVLAVGGGLSQGYKTQAKSETADGAAYCSVSHICFLD